MMNKINFVLMLHSYWHTGNIPGKTVDALTIKEFGLPVFPLDTFQGILKDKARWLEKHNKLSKNDFCDKVFGKAEAKYSEWTITKFSGNLLISEFALEDLHHSPEKAIEIEKKTMLFLFSNCGKKKTFLMVKRTLHES